MRTKLALQTIQVGMGMDNDTVEVLSDDAPWQLLDSQMSPQIMSMLGY